MSGREVHIQDRTDRYLEEQGLVDANGRGLFLHDVRLNIAEPTACATLNTNTNFTAKMIHRCPRELLYLQQLLHEERKSKQQCSF